MFMVILQDRIHLTISAADAVERLLEGAMSASVPEVSAAGTQNSRALRERLTLSECLVDLIAKRLH
jgi:hypothetical protein